MFPLYLIAIIDLIVYILLMICINNVEVYCKVINIFFFNTYVILRGLVLLSCISLSNDWLFKYLYCNTLKC